MSQPLLEGDYLEQESSDLEELREEISQLKDELRRAKAELQKEQIKSQQALNAMTALRQMLNPFHRLLRGIFGEIEVVLGADVSQPSSATGGPIAQSDPKWESWKGRLPGRPAAIIDLLLIHKDMSAQQIASALHCGKDAVYQTMSKVLGRAGIVSNQNGRYSLKG